MPVSPAAPGRVAVVGVGVRAPGGITDAGSYWSAIMGCRDVTGELPAERRAAFGDEWDDLVTHGGYLDEPFDFDAQFFDISPREARTVDPQHRLLLEVVWEAFEDAGMPPAAVAPATGVFVGITSHDYRQWQPPEPNSYTTVGNGHSFSAGRLAHELGLQGPTFALDTACSSSLVAVHVACRALTAGDCDLAVAAGVNLILSPHTTRAVAKTGALSPDGSSRPFDAAANGFVRGEACGAVLLKRLEDALRDRDRIHAVIEGTAINQDGKSATFTAPNGASQAVLLSALLARTGLTGADVGYHEAHGTGTPLGDPVELRAVVDGMRPAGGQRPLYVGSVKANLGHTESAAGVMGLIKAVQCLERRVIPPQARFDTLNPRIDLTGTGLVIATESRPWDCEVGEHASVSSYGMSGTNACALLSAAPAAGQAAAAPAAGQAAAAPAGGQTAAAPAAGSAPGFMVSARTPAALAELAGRYAKHLAGLADADYPAFAYTATSGRTRLRHTAWVQARDAATAAAAADELAAGLEHPAVRVLDESEPLPWTPSAAERAVATVPGYPWQHVRHVVAVGSQR
ncbi:MAG: beta-ketoacyl synthase N-terminal-like domain-containing protein [Jatrophihabitantaceae bacterium]